MNRWSLSRAASIVCLLAFAHPARADARSADPATVPHPAPIDAFLPKPAVHLSPFDRWWRESGATAPADAALSNLLDALRRRRPHDPEPAGSGEWSAVSPPQLWAHTMVYDPARDWMVMTGGALALRPQNEVWVLRGDGGGGWERLDPAGTPPAPGPAAIVFDSRRERILRIANPSSPVAAVGVRALSLRARPEWSELPAAHAPGSVFASPVAAYDPDADLVIVLGSDGAGLGVQILTLAGVPAWGSIAVSPDGPRGRPVFAGWDRPRHRVLTLTVSPSGESEVWELRMGSPAFWSRIDLPGGSTALAGGVLDAAGNRLLLLDEAQQIWSLPLSGPAAWARLGGPGAKEHLRGFALALDTRRGRLVLHGGFDSMNSLSRTRGFRLEANGPWVEAANRPGATRIWHAAIFDEHRDQMVVYGGWTWNPFLPADSLTALSMRRDATWSGMEATGPAPPVRFGHALVHDLGNDRMVVFGGQSTDGSGGYLADVWELPLRGAAVWHELVPASARGPGVRRFAGAAYDSRRHRMLCFGGDDGLAFHRDAWQLNLDGTPAWSPLPVGGELPGTTYLKAFYDRNNDRVILCGDDVGVWAVPLTGVPRVEPLEPAGDGPPRFSAPLLQDTRRNRLVWFRAQSSDGSYRLEEYWTLSLDGPPRWTHFLSRGLPPPSRHLMSMVYDEPHDRALLYGGFEDETDYFGDTWILAWSDAGRDSILASRPPRGRGLALRGVLSRQGSALVAAITLPEPGEASLEVFDVQGRRVHEQRIEPGAAGARTVRIDPPVPLTAGVYLVRVVQGRESRTARAIVLR